MKTKKRKVGEKPQILIDTLDLEIIEYLKNSPRPRGVLEIMDYLKVAHHNLKKHIDKLLDAKIIMTHAIKHNGEFSHKKIHLTTENSICLREEYKQFGNKGIKEFEEESERANYLQGVLKDLKKIVENDK